MPVLSLACHLPHNTPNIPSRYNNEQTTKQTKAINNSYIYISHVNVTQTVPDISPLMPMHQDPLLVCVFSTFLDFFYRIDNYISMNISEILGWFYSSFQVFDMYYNFETSMKDQFRILIVSYHVNTLRPRQNSRHFADDTFKSIFVNENVIISIKFSLKLVPKGQINNIPALVQVMAWRRPGDKPLSEPVMVSLLTHICVARPQWVNWALYYYSDLTMSQDVPAMAVRH